MEISNNGANQGSWYVNPNTRTLTSNRKNTEIKDRDAFGCMQRLLNPVEDMVKALTTPINLADRTTVNRASNTISIAAGTQIAVNDGYILTVTERGVECHHGKNYDPYDVEAYKRAQGLADSLAVLLRNAGGTQQASAFSREEYQKWTGNVSGVLSYMGLDNRRDFILNGMKYHKNAAGCWESASNSSAKAVYEQQHANNRTFTYADERTRKQTAYISNYYLEHTSERMQAAWQKAMEETGINPFPEGFSSTLSQLAMEQDFATGGNDDIFGADAGSNIAAVQSILDRINDPLGEVSEKDRSFRADEKVFYERVLEHLTGVEGSVSGTSSAGSVTNANNNVTLVSDNVPTSAVSPENAERNAVSRSAKAAKEPYEAYESANYKIEPDNENECFTIYNGQGERLGVFFYSDIKCRQDGASGKEFLISENGTMWYDVLVLDPELKNDLKHAMGADTLKTEPLQGWTLKTHAGTGIQYIMKDGDEGRGGRVLLQSDADRAKYEELAETYFNKYPNLIKSKDEAYIWASFEITGMAVRTETGIISLHYDGASYNDDTDVRNNWSIRFQDDIYKQIFAWLEKNQDRHKEMQKFSLWQGIFDEIGGGYERIWSEPEERQGYLNN